MNLPVGTVVAVGAGASFAAAGVLQQRAAARTPLSRGLSPRLLLTLLHERMWLGGIALAMASYGLQALALSQAPLAIVQPLLVSELIFAIPISARLYGHPLRAREWIGILTVSVGLAATVWGAAPSGGVHDASVLRWAIVAGPIVAGALLLAAAGRRRPGLSRPVLYATGAALLFALSSAFLAVAVARFAASGIGGLSSPAVYAMGAASIAGTFLLQSAFQTGPLAVAMPMVDWAEPLVAVYLGITVLGETIDTSPLHLATLSAGAIAALVGIVALDTSPVVRVLEPPGATPPTPDLSAAACRGRARRLCQGQLSAAPPDAAEQAAISRPAR